MSGARVCFDRDRFERLADAIENMAVGELWKEIPVSPARDELDALAHGINVLSSELRYRLRELQNAQASLIQSGKLAALGEVSSGLAHELNNPLTIVTGYIQLVRARLESARPEDHDPAGQAALLEKAERNLERMAAIIRHIMEFARESRPGKTPTLVADVIEKSLILIHEQMRLKNISVSLELQPGVTAVINASQLEQVFINLLGNARDAILEAHGEAGGRIQVRSRAVSASEVEVRVSDNGIGMTEETRSRVFQPFFSTKEAGKGMGLGLSISHGIVLEHGGAISCESQPGGGATFAIRLPRFVPDDSEES
ncbi:MAG TPA: ATP-binding protein [Vicinamibacterales bacterium]|nr:ATP-binding protein [Vicinamibacterales bacterium]